jgi:acetolactate synthase I/II/III large subunit
MMKTGAQILWECLTREGVTDVFGYPGGAILPAYDAMLEYPIRHILVRHEQGATHMADGYARATGKIGVAISTSGPGATNMVTGIATAMMDSSPIVCITGQVSSHLLGRDAFQEVDITGITLPITKHNYLVKRAEDVAPAIRDAFRVAVAGRPGPVLVDITKDAQQGACDFDWEGAAPARTACAHARASGEDDRALDLINSARRPVILAGHGIIIGRVVHLLRTLAERADIPVAKTLLGLTGFPAAHPLSLGMMGMHGEPWVNQAIQEADLLVALGMRFDDRVTGDLATFAPHARKIHIDIDPAELNKNVHVDVAIAGDLRTVLADWLPRVEARDRSDWIDRLTSFRQDAAARDIRNHPDQGRFHAAHLLHDLWQSTGGDALVVTDVGQHQMWAAQCYKHNEPRMLITSGGLGTMGFALPAAIGAKVARPDAEVWAIAGDGGFQMTLPELATIAQEGLDINIVVVNNGYLGMVRQWQEFFYERRYSATPLLSPDFAKLAEAYGLRATTVRQRSELPRAIAAARRHPGAWLLDCRVEQEDNLYPMVPTGAPLHEMILRPLPAPPVAARM